MSTTVPIETAEWWRILVGMRIIIIIQSIIILLGGYYFYTQSLAKPVPAVIVPTLSPVATSTERVGYKPPTENPPGYTVATTSSSTGVSGASDAGMEYPTMDTDLPEVR